MIPLTSVVSLASPLAVMVGKKTVAVPLVLLGDPPPGDMMVKGETGMLLNLAISSIKLEFFPLVNGEFTRCAEVGSP